MKRLDNYTILYDSECPMCSLYSQALVNSGVLSEEGRASYQETPAEACPLVDQQRAVDEIALINNHTGEVTYGIYSLFEVLSNSFPGLRPLLSFKPFAWLMTKAYAFISFNRRVIAPPAKNPAFQLQPTFKLHYRLAYILVLGTIASLIFSGYIKTSGAQAPNVAAYIVIIFGVQALIALLTGNTKIWDYLGNLATILFMGALLLLVFLIINLLGPFPILAFGIYLLLTAALMTAEHIRRTRKTNSSPLLNLTWVIAEVCIFYPVFSSLY